MASLLQGSLLDFYGDGTAAQGRVLTVSGPVFESAGPHPNPRWKERKELKQAMKTGCCPTREDTEEAEAISTLGTPILTCLLT